MVEIVHYALSQLWNVKPPKHNFGTLGCSSHCRYAPFLSFLEDILKRSLGTGDACPVGAILYALYEVTVQEVRAVRLPQEIDWAPSRRAHSRQRRHPSLFSWHRRVPSIAPLSLQGLPFFHDVRGSSTDPRFAAATLLPEEARGG